VRRIPADNIGQVDDLGEPDWVTFEGGIGPSCGSGIRQVDDAG
jgi:hypothetical protein